MPGLSVVPSRHCRYVPIADQPGAVKKNGRGDHSDRDDSASAPTTWKCRRRRLPYGSCVIGTWR
jgi:hypothetical protein